MRPYSQSQLCDQRKTNSTIDYLEQEKFKHFGSKQETITDPDHADSHYNVYLT